MAAQTCLRCGRECDEHATVCFGCGAPLGETKTPTQPVPVPKLPLAETNTGDEHARADASVATAVASQQPAPKRRRRRALLVAIVALVLLAAGTGSYIVINATLATVTGQSVASMATYRDPSGRFTFRHPALWQTTRLADGVQLTDSDGASTVRVTLAPAGALTTAIARADLLATSEELATLPDTTVAGAVWQRRGGQVTGSDGAVRQVTVLVTVHDGTVYTIEMRGPVASFSATDNLVFQPLLASFAFA